MSYVEFYWLFHNFETNVNLGMKFSPKIETCERLSGVKFQNHWCSVSYFTDQKKKNTFWSVNWTSVTWLTQQFADSWQMLLPYFMWRFAEWKLQNSFYINFSILWYYFCLFCKMILGHYKSTHTIYGSSEKNPFHRLFFLWIWRNGPE